MFPSASRPDAAVVTLAFVVCLSVPRALQTSSRTVACRSAAREYAEHARANDNRAPAGVASRGVLRLVLEVHSATWFPEADDGCGIPVYAFAERGKRATMPGPLIRVRAGTRLHVTIRNPLDRGITIWGFQDHDRPPPLGPFGIAVPDSGIVIAPHASRDVRFTATEPGTYAYIGRVGGSLFEAAQDERQLGGAFIVDPVDAPNPPTDRVLVLSRWSIPGDTAEGPMPPARFQVNAVNGKSWPYTERLTYSVGDSIRWRVIHLGDQIHPMHLHGFYFRVERRGNWLRDSLVVPAARTVVTEELIPSETMTIAWKADRPGNWLFHCHLVEHTAPSQRLSRMPEAPLQDTLGTADDHAAAGMAGLIVGISVREREASSATSVEGPRRLVRLFANERGRDGSARSDLGFVVQEGPTTPALDSVHLPGSPIVLTRGEPSQITVFNRLSFPLSVHWHGIELESYFDGVGGWSGTGSRIAPPIAPGDSFIVRITPPRAGTFMYHVHGEAEDELARGLYGALIVLDGARMIDTLTERLIVLSDGLPRRSATSVNGSVDPPPIRLAANRSYRFRFIGISSFTGVQVSLERGRDTLSWLPLARDGAELPSDRIPVPAVISLEPGMTADFSVTAERGDLTLRVRTFVGPFEARTTILRVLVQ